MSEIVVHHWSSVPPYEGPHAIDGIRFRPARQVLGVQAWGMNVIEIDAGCEAYPTHDHAGDGQEEVYLVLRGQAELCIGERTWSLAQGDMVRVPPEANRGFRTSQGVSLLALGATPGKPYVPGPGM